MRLTGTNSYTNGTWVEGGTLRVDGLLGAAAGPVIVTNGAVLTGTGTLQRPVRIASGSGTRAGGHLGAGSPETPGTLTIAHNLEIAPGSSEADRPILTFRVAPQGNDRVEVQGNLTIPAGGRIGLELNRLNGGWVNGRSFTLLTWKGTDPAVEADDFDLILTEPTWSGGQVIVDKTANEIRIAGLQDSVINIGVTNLTDTSANLVGELLATSASPTEVWAFWDTEDHGTNKSWTHAAHAVAPALGLLINTATGLSPNTSYFFTYYASNAAGDVWAEPSVAFYTWGPPEVDNANGATHIGFDSAVLHGCLVKGKEALVGFAWGEETEALTNFSLVGVVSNGTFSAPIGGLEPGSVYYYRTYGSNAYGLAWADETAALTTTPRGAILYCATNGPAWGDGSSWEMAFPTLQTALDATTSNTELRLAGHTFWITNALTLSGREGIALLGGWEGSGNPGNRDPGQWPTLLARPTGSLSNRLMIIHAVTGTLSGLSFRNGAPSDANYQGGALVVSNASLVLERCNFIENGLPYSTATSARRYGGALYAAQSDLLITNSLFTSNTISSYQQNRNHGGAIYVTNGTLTIVDTLFVANRISSTGGPEPTMTTTTEGLSMPTLRSSSTIAVSSRTGLRRPRGDPAAAALCTRPSRSLSRTRRFPPTGPSPFWPRLRAAPFLPPPMPHSITS